MKINELSPIWSCLVVGLGCCIWKCISQNRPDCTVEYTAECVAREPSNIPRKPVCFPDRARDLRTLFKRFYRALVWYLEPRESEICMRVLFDKASALRRREAASSKNK